MPGVRPSASLRLALPLLILLFLSPPARSGRTLRFEDLMRFRKIENPVISRDGRWIAYTLRPDRGDAEAIVQSSENPRKTFTIERGAQPVISSDSRWAAAKVEVPFADQERKGEGEEAEDDAEKQDEPRPGVALVSLDDGSILVRERVQGFAFSDDGAWLAVHFFPEEEEAEADSTAEGEAPPGEGEADDDQTEEEEREPGGTLLLRHLASGHETELLDVAAFAFDEPSLHLAYAVATTTGIGNELRLRTLGQGAPPEVVLHAADRATYRHLSWADERSRLAYLAGLEETKDEVSDVELRGWDVDAPDDRALASSADAPAGWEIPATNELVWSEDGERLFFGFKPVKPESKDEQAQDAEASGKDEPSAEKAPPEETFDPYDVDGLLEQVTLDVWHWNDPRIAPHQRKRWDEEKDRTYRAVVHLETGRVVPLADEGLPDVAVTDNPDFALASSDVPYLREITWAGWYDDLHVVDLRDGTRREVATHIPHEARSLSPAGRFVVYYDDAHWHLFETATGERRNLTRGLPVSFADEDHDYPSPPGSYGVGGWVAEDTAVLLYDKYDIWQFPTDGGAPFPLTGGSGREKKVVYRLIDLDPEEPGFQPDERLLLLAYDDTEKNDAFYRARVGTAGIERLREKDKRFRFLAKAEEAERILYTEESYTEFPDLWVSDLSLKRTRKVSEANPQLEEFDWGKAELVEWTSLDGIPLQGVLIKPAGYDDDERYPVLVYFYRFFSQRLHEFNEPVINHRPSFPVYASDGYAVFLPDIRFEIGRPGLAAVKCLVPGVQKLVDMGVADPDAIGLHGHSWSGYQTAYVVTQTDIFAAAVAGAPVSNMTSAYSGIRWGTGLARQFQYEMGQSRIGNSLYENPLPYLENSPVFYADRIHTPLLIQFGDEDEAVPWYQGIELYLAMRRLGKECVFLQYRGEPHHLKKYPNKLDYSIKMKEFFDHFCKGEPAPSWWSEGVSYQGD